MRGYRAICLLILAFLMTVPVWAQSGEIEGTITREDGSGIGGVTVVVSELGAVEITSKSGTFRFSGVPSGSYTLSFSLGDNADSESGVEVAAGDITAVTKKVDWDVSFAETITVYSASRRQERIVDAPASISVFDEEDIERQAATGQIAKVVEFAPGVEVNQSGIFDINLNARGFNSSLNRRVQTIVDGREPSVPFLGSTEWGFLSNLQDMAVVELVRGPSSALYGANAFNGVLNLITKAPRDHQGGRIGLTAGELSTLKADFLWAGELGSDWYVKVGGSYNEGKDFSRSRIGSTEYAGLPTEVESPNPNYDSTHLNLRLDKYFGANLFTIEGGTYDAFGSTVVTGIGRVNIQDVERTWARVNLSGGHYNLLAYTNTRKTPDQHALASGGRIFLDSENYKVEAQTNWDFSDGKVRLVAGASFKEEEIDSSNFAGFQTLVFAPVKEDYTAFFAQLDFDVGDNLKLVLAGRFDDSSLHDSQVSPKAALVWSINPKNTLRFSYNEAFQVPNYSEFFLDAPTAIAGVGASIDLSGIEAALCTPFGVSCGFGSPTRIKALGNVDLELEEITSFEIGYSAILGNKGYLTVDFYQNELDNFITDLTANVFGSINPNFGPYTPPASHPLPDLLRGTLAGALGPLIAFLSNNVDGTPIFALASYTNAGAVDTQGIDIGLNYYITPQWQFDFSYSWFDFEIKEASAGSDVLLPNAAENRFSLGITYSGPQWGGAAKFRWVDDFDWAAGAFAGPVESYSVVNLSGYYDINENITVGANISNAFDDEHYESFGGDLLNRRALGYVTFRF